MSGIAKIQEKRDVVKANFNNPSSSFIGNKEIWLRDGDQIFCTPVASGEEGDPNLDEYYLYTFRSDNRWTHVLKHDEVDASDVPTDIRPSHKFAFGRLYTKLCMTKGVLILGNQCKGRETELYLKRLLMISV